jgi:hypothetical protein
MSLPQMAELAKDPLITLVDLAGRPIPAEADAASWPPSNEADGWYWEPDPVVTMELIQAETDRMADAADGSVPYHDEDLARAILEGALSPGARLRGVDEPFLPGPEPEPVPSALPPVAGGCTDEPEPFVPTDRDWEDLYQAGRVYPAWGVCE